MGALCEQGIPMHGTYILLRRLGEHRGAPRLYLDTPALERAGLRPGSGFELQVDGAQRCLTLRSASPSAQGTRRVSRKRRGAREVPVLDINSTEHLAAFLPCGVVRIVICAGAVHLLLPASAPAALERLERLRGKLARGEPLAAASIAFGAGIATNALHEGLAAAGVRSTMVLANETQRAVRRARQRITRCSARTRQRPPSRCRKPRSTSG